MYLRYLLYYEICWVFRVQRVHEERARYWRAWARKRSSSTFLQTHMAQGTEARLRMLVVRAGLETYSMQSIRLALSIGGICTVGRATGTGMKAAVSNCADRALRACVHARSRSERISIRSWCCGC